MKYNDFIKAVSDLVNKALQEGSRAELRSVLKNNGVRLDCLTIKSEDESVAPTIYLNDFYEQYERGRGLSEVAEDIIDLAQKEQFPGNFDVSFLAEYDSVRSRIVCKIINWNLNRELLQNVPFRKYKDLAVVFLILLPETEGSNATILIRNEQMQHWDVGPEELFQDALDNMPVLLPWILKGMKEVITGSLFNIEDVSEGMDSFSGPEEQMYVLSNERGFLGATAILYPGVLESCRERIGTDFFIIPSSIHELILVPVSASVDPEKLDLMIHEVNRTVVSPEEVLSDHVYQYDQDGGLIDNTLKAA